MTTHTSKNATGPASTATNPRIHEGATPTDPLPTPQDNPRHKIDLLPAAKVLTTWERETWLKQMLEPEGMSPGASSRAHARAFRFAEALMKQGYTVTEAPHGPRGGRRFTLDSYEGPRAGVIHQLKYYRSCCLDHTDADCGCFDDLSDDQLKLVGTLARKTRSYRGRVCDTDTLAALIRQHGEHTVRAAVDLYCVVGGRWRDPTLHEYIALIQDHDLETLRGAVYFHASVSTVERGGPTVHELLQQLVSREPRAVQLAVELFCQNGGSRDGQPGLTDLINAIDASIT